MTLKRYNRKRGEYMAKFCINCGQELEPNNKYCPNCGKTINEEENKNNGNNDNNDNIHNNHNTNSKSKVAAGILGILLGSLGIHNFYLGYTGKAIAQLLITVLSCGTLALISGIWGLVEGIMILVGTINTDAFGNPLGQ